MTGSMFELLAEWPQFSGTRSTSAHDFPRQYTIPFIFSLLLIFSSCRATSDLCCFSRLLFVSPSLAIFLALSSSSSCAACSTVWLQQQRLYTSCLFYRFVDILHHLLEHFSKLSSLPFFPFSSSTDFLLTSSSNHQTTARIIVLCVKCFCFCCDYQQPLWLRCVAFVWLLWRSSKNVPSCRLDSGHFDRPTKMIHTVWRKLKKSILVVLRPLLFNSSFEIAPPLSDLSTSLSNLNPLN